MYRNDSAGGNWIKIALKGVEAESHGIGSKVEVEAGGKKMIREIDGGGSSHISQNSVIAHFGLGNATKIDKITVLWTGGNKQTITGISVNHLITITEIPLKKKPGIPYAIISMGLVVVAFALLYLRRRRKS